LIDVRAKCQVEPELAFTLEFQFAPNEYFKNEVLTKTYYMNCELDTDDPFGFDGPEIYKAVGCTIDWNEGKDVTKSDLDNEANTFFPCSDSFFTFFNPPSVPSYDIPGYDKIEEYLENDFEIGHFIKERVIPRAVMFFLGEYEDIMSSEETTEVPNTHIYFDSETEEISDAKNADSEPEQADS
jgi:nucleosome assembly protein 1-like 1